MIQEAGAILACSGISDGEMYALSSTGAPLNDDRQGFWAVHLIGDPADLETWADLLPEAGNPSILCRESRFATKNFYLPVPRLAEAKERSDLHGIADEAVEQLNGLIMIAADADPVRAGTVVFFRADGKTDQYVKAEGIRLRLRMGRPKILINGVEPELCSTNVQVWWQLAVGDDLLMDACRFFASAAHLGGSQWFDLYKAYEVLERFIGGRQRFWQRGWVDRTQDDLFYKAANYYRHTHVKASRPETPMSLDDGRGFIRQLIQKALYTKGS
jgi:hypothetical protein